MGLDEFMEGDVDSGKKEESNTPVYDKENNLNKEYSHSPEEVDRDKEHKLCPKCMSLSPKEGDWFWRCTNPDCGIKEFKMSYKEWHQVGWDDEHILSDVNFEDALGK